MSTTKEKQVDRRTSSLAKLSVTALLIGIAAVGCGKGNGAGAGQQNQTAPAAVSTQADMAGASAGSSASASVAPGSSAAPIDGDLSNLDQLINNLNGSLSGADAGPSGGE
jgi:hypothetical protein